MDHPTDEGRKNIKDPHGDSSLYLCITPGGGIGKKEKIPQRHK